MHAAYMLHIGRKRTLFVFNKVAAAILIGGKSSSDSVILLSGSLDDRIDECTRDEMVIGILTIGMFFFPYSLEQAGVLQELELLLLV